MVTQVSIDLNSRTGWYDMAIWVEGLGTVHTAMGCHSPDHAMKLAREWWNKQIL